MNEETKAELAEEKSSFLPIILMITIAIVLAGAITYVYASYNDAEIQHLRTEIDNRENVSDDYITGWNDCIQELIDFRNTATNVTKTLN